MKTILFAMLVSFTAFSNEAETEGKTPTEARAFCNVSMMGGFNVVGGRCRFFDEVMTGIVKLDPLTIRCSRVSVNCNRQGQPLPTTLEEIKIEEER